MKLLLLLTLVSILTCGHAQPSSAVTFQRILIADQDGFGFGDGAGLLNFQGNPVNVDGVGILGAGPPADFLPDLNQDGLVQFAQGDDFDNRSAGEIAGTSVGGVGFTNTGCTGAQFTDISLSTSFDVTFSPPNDFPDPPATNRNDARFEFRFFVATADIVAGTPMFFNMVFGDIGQVAGEVIITFASGSPVTVPVSPINPSVEDGLIDAASISLAFNDVFTATTGGWDGHVDVLFRTRPGTAGGDPYYSIDYAELSPIEGPVPTSKATWGQVKGRYR